MKRLMLCLVLMFGMNSLAQAADPECEGRFVNPITDVCWSCIFPLSIGSVAVSSGSVPDTANPSSPIQICPVGILYRVGLAIGYWEPMALTDVTRSPYCMVNLGGFNLNVGKIGTGTAGQSDKPTAGAFYHVHWYKYPVTYWLNIITSLGCLQSGDMDIGYLSELDPMWNDSSLSLIISPESMLFGNVIAQGACAADALASAVNKPLDYLFWCAGSHGSMYPFTGYTSNEFSPLQSSVLLSERMAFKLHRQGLIMNSIGQDTAVCYEYPSPIMPKERWRYQMVNMYPDVAQCHPVGQTVMRWEAGHNPPNSRKNFGYLMWRKRNCVFL
ncbi:MAG: conjugal transfer pilus assembly protein TraU [Yersiniaceae bacterium]|uniref:conjugal transfer pilus assembly protein TraU n=1 Tax=Nissabacter sp. SGAir0207 TaxID=2126321 RepID=UPI0010CD6637|nr:conjugal transfer pilus assembly protein TraU [Nissabacter sp. SGAir0207]MDU6412070.1 conjugal transfer pilus assembly protein TraU [Yersiniaceae bacterium]QCR38924.1 conjugal transfer protein TraU [Nissabacter sp. SGAir0207]